MKNVIWLLLILLIVLRYFYTRPVYNNGDTVRISTTVLSDPLRFSFYQYLKIAGLKIYLPKFPEISYGDNVVIEGIVDNGKLKNPKLLKGETKKNIFSNFRNSIISFYQNTLPEPMAGLLGGIVIGAKGALQNDFYNKTKLVGVAHVVVASGTNITFVVSFLMGVLTIFLPRRKLIPFVILGIILYLCLSGFDAPLIRASIMASVLFLSQGLGRLVSTWRILILTGLLMLIYNPDWILDIGFILSFVSVASLLLFEKRIRRWLKIVPEVFKEGLSTSLSAQIGVALILFVTFGQFNIWSIFVNVLVLWTIPYLMILGAVGGVVGLILPFVGKVILWLSYPMLWWFTQIVSLFAKP